MLQFVTLKFEVQASNVKLVVVQKFTQFDGCIVEDQSEILLTPTQDDISVKQSTVLPFVFNEPLFTVILYVLPLFRFKLANNVQPHPTPLNVNALVKVKPFVEIVFHNDVALKISPQV